MTTCHTLQHTSIPEIWLLSDARNDAALDDALRALPEGSGFVFRHYHLEEARRRARFDALAAIARLCGHWVILSDHGPLAKHWGADGIYAAPSRLAGAEGMIRLAAVHDEEEINAANRLGANAVFLSPVFTTRTHPGARGMGADRFHQLAALAEMPVIALGGMTAKRAQLLDWPHWAAIDGLVSAQDS